MDLNKRLTVIIPVFNEEETIQAVVERVLERPETGEVIVIDDASSDNTREKLQVFKDHENIKLLHHEHNQGKGAAVIKGIPEATKDCIIIQDADFEYTPEDWPEILAPLADGKADVVYGSRFMGTPGMARYFRHEMGNKFLTFWSNVFSDPTSATWRPATRRSAAKSCRT
jgi:glycosyltransferase involved in cell wall biosynthesis